MSTTHKATEIARGLTPMDADMLICCARGVRPNRTAERVMARAGLVDGFGRLTPLGRAVAAALQPDRQNDWYASSPLRGVIPRDDAGANAKLAPLPVPCPHCDADHESAYDLDGLRYCRRCDADLPPTCETCMWASCPGSLPAEQEGGVQCGLEDGYEPETCGSWEPAEEADSPEEG